jgi:hypothetical protein
MGAEAFATGNHVAFAGTPSLHTAAHEAAHVVQQRGGVQLKGGVGQVGDQYERHADAVADLVVRGESAEGLLGAYAPSGWEVSRGVQVQRFAPEGHQKAVVAGLTGSFGTEEIGEIYSANWERDFSQGSRKIADLVLAWKEVKRVAAQDEHAPFQRADFQKTAFRFRSAALDVVSMGKLEATDESMGGYRPWEHLDNPGNGEANRRWATKQEMAGKLPGYILDGKAYLKDQMVSAVNTYRDSLKLGSAGEFDNWHGHAKPKGYNTPKDVENPRQGRGVIADETAEKATEEANKQGVSMPPRVLEGGHAAFAAAGQHLGRATHVLEDFFAHSNWLELAKEIKKATLDGTNPPESKLITGTFEMPDKCHALGHKLVALAKNLQKDFDVLLKVFGRQQASTLLNQKGHEKDRKKAFGALDTNSSTVVGELYDVGSAAGDVDSMATRIDIADIFTNREWLAALERKGNRMIEHGDDAAPRTGHGKLAKDQAERPHAGNEKDFAGAHALAVAADHAIIGPLAAAMRSADASKTHEFLAQQLEMVDRIVAAPSADHPLFGLVEVK